MQQLSLFDPPVQDTSQSNYTDTYAASRGIHPTYRIITVGTGNTLLFAQHNDYNYYVDTFTDRAQAKEIRSRLNKDAETMVKRKRIRVKRLVPLTEQEWEALPARPRLWHNGELVEMQWDEQVSRK